MTPYLFVMLDTVPDFIQKTFGLDEDGRYPGNVAMQTIREGDDIPKDVDFAVVIFNNDGYHYAQVTQLVQQIQAISPGAHVMWLPVWG